MATREVYPTAAIYTVCSVAFSTNFVMMRRSPSLTLTSVWAAFWVYQVCVALVMGINASVSAAFWVYLVRVWVMGMYVSVWAAFWVYQVRVQQVSSMGMI